MKLIRKLIGWSMLATFFIALVAILGPIMLISVGIVALFFLAIILIAD